VILTLYEKDERIDEYLDQQWPASWKIEPVDMLGNGPSYNEILRRYPMEHQYGFLADDAVLSTPNMLNELEAEADLWNVAYANDQHHGANLCTMPCIGGELVRLVGYLSPQWIVHWGIDNVWQEIGRVRNCLRYREDLKYDHLHPLFGTGKMDKTYSDAKKASMFYAEIFRSWQVAELPRLRAA
jgi:hypothetical protein